MFLGNKLDDKAPLMVHTHKSNSDVGRHCYGYSSEVLVCCIMHLAQIGDLASLNGRIARQQA